MFDMELSEFKNEGGIPYLQESFLQSDVLYVPFLGDSAVAKSTFMILDFTKVAGHELIKAEDAVEWFEDINQGNQWNTYCATDYLEAFLRDIDYRNRTELHNKRIAFISDLQVYEAERGKGYGKQVLQQMLKRCEKDGVEYVFLYPSPIGDKEKKVENTFRLYSFYEQAGFVEYEHGDVHRLVPEKNAYLIKNIKQEALTS